jgi:AcrR family transcriptional regulator
VATQEQRRADTRRRLLDAAAELFAERGVEGASIDAIAELADRTSGAIYDHFGGKEGLLFALLEGWVDDVAAVIGAELATATTLDERLSTLWRNVAEPPSGDGRWIALEHELWSWAARHPEAREHLARRYQAAFVGVELAATEWLGGRPAPGTGATVIGLLLGLEMMRRIDGSAVDERVALAALKAAVTGMNEGVPAR